MTGKKHYLLRVARVPGDGVRAVFSNPLLPDKLRGDFGSEEFENVTHSMLAAAFKRGKKPEEAGIERTILGVHLMPYSTLDDGDVYYDTGYVGKKKFWLVYKEPWPHTHYDVMEAEGPFRGDPKKVLRKMPEPREYTGI
jgi:hypothetical protein